LTRNIWLGFVRLTKQSALPRSLGDRFLGIWPLYPTAKKARHTAEHAQSLTFETFGAPSLLKTMTGADDLSQPFPNCDANYKARTKDEKNGDGGSTAETRKMAKSKIQTQAGKSHKRFGTENAAP
jgi:hypothetical protein